MNGSKRIQLRKLIFLCVLCYSKKKKRKGKPDLSLEILAIAALNHTVGTPCKCEGDAVGECLDFLNTT